MPCRSPKSSLRSTSDVSPRRPALSVVAGLSIRLALVGMLASVATANAVDTPATQVSLRQARQALQQQRAEVQRLQQALAQQQRLSRQASERLRQQDAAIAALQKRQQVGHPRKAPDGH